MKLRYPYLEFLAMLLYYFLVQWILVSRHPCLWFYLASSVPPTHWYSAKTLLPHISCNVVRTCKWADFEQEGPK